MGVAQYVSAHFQILPTFLNKLEYSLQDLQYQIIKSSKQRVFDKLTEKLIEELNIFHLMRCHFYPHNGTEREILLYATETRTKKISRDEKLKKIERALMET